MFALMPALGALLQDFVVTLLVLLDETFQADIAAGLDPAMVTGEQEQQARDAAVAVPERMDAQEIEIQRGGQGHGRDPFLFHAPLP
jgi:hypothetical protein